MANDLVERLRDCCEWDHTQAPCRVDPTRQKCVTCQAADALAEKDAEIARLRILPAALDEQIGKLTEENRALRERLKKELGAVYFTNSEGVSVCEVCGVAEGEGHIESRHLKAESTFPPPTLPDGKEPQ